MSSSDDLNAEIRSSFCIAFGFIKGILERHGQTKEYLDLLASFQKTFDKIQDQEIRSDEAGEK